MKKIFLFFLAFMLALSAAACSGAVDNNSNTNDNDGETVISSEINPMVNVPENTTAEETKAYEYIGIAVEFYQLGMDFNEVGGRYFADSAFALAAAYISSMRYAAECLLEVNGTNLAQDNKLRDWDEIAALCWASPYAWFFEGIVLEAQGNSSEAAECYRKAALNPGFTEDMEDWKAIKDFDTDMLRALLVELERWEDTIFEVTFGPRFIYIPRDENNFDVEFLNQKALESLDEDENDILGPLGYFLAALQINPLDGDSYANIAVMYMFMEDGVRVNETINSGLIADPDNERLKLLQETYKEALSQ